MKPSHYDMSLTHNIIEQCIYGWISCNMRARIRHYSVCTYKPGICLMRSFNGVRSPKSSLRARHLKAFSYLEDFTMHKATSLKVRHLILNTHSTTYMSWLEVDTKLIKAIPFTKVFEWFGCNYIVSILFVYTMQLLNGNGNYSVPI